ncbi:hypothetical protein DCAR_0830859 [Daucus carota subsp. sativus]|uniref:Uncharacterized protein n=1 Tax=Daucus carota subsp. sativus TaxID=79200 RepID=A0AAF1BCN1_DAUCS|nr:hypothetical protein DCAR_0830859 [Daucus carota subsp. sativus]
MAPKSSLPQTNYAGIQSAADATGCFQQIVLFMNNSNLKIPIIATPLINMDRLDQFWKTAKNQGTEEVPSVDFKIDGKEYMLIVTHINEAFGTTVAENESFADLGNDDTLSKFFLYIGYAGLVPDKNSTKWYPTSEMDKRYMRKEWNMLFDAMVKIFSTKTSGWNGIPSYIKKLTHSMVHGYKVNVGKVVMAQLRSSISKKIHTSEKPALEETHVDVGHSEVLTNPFEVAVTASVAVNDSAGTTTSIVVDTIPAIKTSLVVTSPPAIIIPTDVFTRTDTILSTKVVVTSTQHLHLDVIIEDGSDDENVPLCTFFKV